MQERASTGRIYIANVDHINEHGAFIPALAPVRQSNLCMEITLPTRPLAFTDDPNGEIALCTLSAFNLGAIRSLESLKEVAFYAVAALDSLLDYQDYPMEAAEVPAKARRSLGIGVTNFAYYPQRMAFVILIPLAINWCMKHSKLSSITFLMPAADLLKQKVSVTGLSRPNTQLVSCRSTITVLH